jgi:hypothetical protein
VKLDSVVLSNNIEICYYRYDLSYYTHDKDLINEDTVIKLSINQEYMLSGNNLILSENYKDSNKIKMVNLKTFRRDSINIFPTLPLLCYCSDKNVKVNYLPRKFNYSAVDIKCYPCISVVKRFRYCYGKGIDLIEISHLEYGRYTFHKVDYIPPFRPPTMQLHDKK